jgi:SAM-dependent methyltransferase
LIVDQAYWNNSYEKFHFSSLPDDDPTKKLLSRFIPDAEKWQTAYEPGCFPGRFLLEIGMKGYILNGCDLTPRVEFELKEWLEKEKGCRVGDIVRENYLDVDESIQFDLVCSFGFIEHFENYPEIFLKQLKMVKKSGMALIQFPNFYGFAQRLLHYYLDKDNLNNHVIEAMNLKSYKHLIPENYEIVFMGYYGNFEFWHDDFNRTNTRIQKNMLGLLYRTKRFWSKLPDSEYWSPYGAIILKKHV